LSSICHLKKRQVSPKTKPGASMSVKIREKPLSTGERSLYLDVYHKGRRERIFLDLRLTGKKDHDKEAFRLAETIRAQKELEVLTGAFGLLSANLGKVPLLDYCRIKAEKKGLKDHLRKALKYIEAFNPTIQLKAVDERFLEGFQERLTASGLGPATAGHYFDAINGVLNQAVKERILLRNPGQAVKRIKVPERLKDYLTLLEVQALANTPIMGEDGTGGEIRRAFLFSCYTGLRWSDLKALTWGMIRDNKIQMRQAKTQQSVYIPLNKTALTLIETPGQQIHHKDENIFGLTGTDPNQYLHPWGLRAGVQKHFTFHTARHTNATLLLEHGADLFTVQRLLGHSKAEMTMGYAKVTDGKKRAASEAIPGLDLKRGSRA
jgi:integrase